MSNIMFREDELGHVFGVPNDLDLASLLSELESGTSLRRTGTPPFMALDLQNPHKLQVRHLYRHDLESLFYVLLMLVCRHDFTREKKRALVLREKPPFNDWFDYAQSWSALKRTKVDFFQDTNEDFIKAQIAPGFKQFEVWVISIWKKLGAGFVARQQVKLQPTLGRGTDDRLLKAIKAGRIKEPVMKAKLTIDDETLGGNIDYWSFCQYMTRLDRDLLEFRCPDLGL